MAEEPGFDGRRIADSDRDRIVALLRHHCTEGRLSLDEFGDLVGAVYAARTAADLDGVIADLPVPWSPPSVVQRPNEPARTRGATRWLVAIFGDSVRRGRFRLDDESVVFAAFGDCVLDLSEALIDSGRPMVTAVAVFGDVTVIVPDGIAVDFDGIAIFGDKKLSAGEGPSLPGSPVVHVRALAAFGDVRVRPPKARANGRRRSTSGAR